MGNISIYRAPIKNLIPDKHISPLAISKMVKGPKYVDVTGKLRAITDPTERTKYKSTRLDYATMSGEFKQRSDSGLIQHSNYFCIDLDHVGDTEALNEIKEKVLGGYTPALMFVSPSGDGLKIVYQIDTEQGTHLQYFKAFQSYFRTEFNTEIDEKCKDVSRACFLPYDPECFYSDTPDTLNRDFLNTYQAEPEEWDGNVPRASRGPVEPLKDKYLIIAHCTKWAKQRYPFEEGNRNKYISELCGLYNRAGLDEADALTDLLGYAEAGFEEAEIKATVKSIYSNTALHGIAPMEDSREPEEPEPTEATPLMPIDGFPDFIQDLIIECSGIYGTHRDLWAFAFLAATSSAIGQSTMLKGKYNNTPLFWMAVVGASGVGKSEPVKFAFKPLHSIDYTAFELHEESKAKYQADKVNATKGEKPQPPDPCKQIIVIDTTPEAMAKALNSNPRGITIVREELHGWFKDFDKYNKSGEQQNMLSNWSQQPFKVNRVSGDNLFIKEPFVNVFGGIQRKIIPEMAKDNRAANGFLPRFCFVFPDKIEAPPYVFDAMPEASVNRYAAYINTLLALPGYRNPVFLDFDAEGLYAEFYNKNAALNNSGRQPDYLNEVNSKLNIIVLRTALLLHCSHQACSGKDEKYINYETMEAAINLTEYFRATAKKVYRLINQQRKELSTKEAAIFLKDKGHSQSAIARMLKCSQQNVNKIFSQI